jgi:hypothetical protein
MEFTSDMLRRLSFGDMLLLQELYAKCQEVVHEDVLRSMKQTEWKWKMPGPAFKAPKAEPNPQQRVGTVTAAVLVQAALASAGDRG